MLDIAICKDATPKLESALYLSGTSVASLGGEDVVEIDLSGENAPEAPVLLKLFIKDRTAAQFLSLLRSLASPSQLHKLIITFDHRSVSMRLSLESRDRLMLSCTSYLGPRSIIVLWDNAPADLSERFRLTFRGDLSDLINELIAE
jgi:hypothetical protein